MISVTRPLGGRRSTSLLAVHVSGFIVRTQGDWSDGDLARFRDYLKARNLMPSESELAEVIREARDVYLSAGHRLHVCGASHCRNACGFDLSDTALRVASNQARVPILSTGCQGLCKQAPIAALRVGGRTQVLSQFARRDDWSAVLEYARAAVTEGSLLADSGSAGRFFHDPVHDRDPSTARLDPLRFLVGRFRGEGRHALDGYAFEKEVVGVYEAGNRFIALRMEASYPTPDGHRDIHRALVIVGAGELAGALVAHAFTDGGLTHEYAIEERDGAFWFDDEPPDHGHRWKHARKVIQPSGSGYEERLEVDAEDGVGFRPYYTISMKRRKQ